MIRRYVIGIFGLCLSLGMSCVWAQSTSAGAGQEKVVTTLASGTFDVKVTSQAAEAGGADGDIGRMLLDKRFHGDLEGTSKGQMLAAMSSVKGSAGYVAMERFTGTLKGRSGSFVLQHMGVMTRGAPQLTVSVVPDSGTGQLVGLTGTMKIIIADGKHSYEFEYALASTP